MNTEYDTIAKEYSNKSMDDLHIKIFYEQWVEVLGNLKGKKVLEPACGSGFSSRLLSENGAKVTGFDVSKEMIKLAKEQETENPMGIEYFVCDAKNLGLIGEFDVVASAFFLVYARTIQELRKFVINISNNLKPGGKFVSIEKNPLEPTIDYYPGTRVVREWVGKEFQDGSKMRVILFRPDGSENCRFTIYYWSKKTINDILADADFRDIEWVNIDYEGEEFRYLDSMTILSAHKGK